MLGKADFLHKKKETHIGFPLCCALQKELFYDWKNRYIRFSTGFLFERNSPIDQREKRVVSSQTYVFTGIVLGSSLANDDVAGFGKLTAENFNP